MSEKMPAYRLLDAETSRKMLKDFKGERTGWVQVGEKKWLFPHRYIEQGEGFFNFEARPSDTWVLSYPRSGTTWTQELVWLVANDMDFEKANSNLLAERFPFLEFSMFNHPELTKEFVELNKGNAKKVHFCKELAKPGYELLANIESPRFIKSHFPLSLLPKVLSSGCKIVYVARNPKDVAVSWYKLNQAFKTQGYLGNFPQFWNYFINDLNLELYNIVKAPWSPYWEHVKEAWDVRHRDNFLFLFYEELQQNLPAVIARVATFFGKKYSDCQISKLVKHLNITNFRNNLMVNSQELKDCGIISKESKFIRKGVSGGWKDYFTGELDAEANQWIEQHLNGYSIEYPFTNNNPL